MNGPAENLTIEAAVDYTSRRELSYNVVDNTDQSSKLIDVKSPLLNDQCDVRSLEFGWSRKRPATG